MLLPVSQIPPCAGEWEYPTVIAGVPQETYLDWMRSAYFVSATASPAISLPTTMCEIRVLAARCR